MKAISRLLDQADDFLWGVVCTSVSWRTLIVLMFILSMIFQVINARADDHEERIKVLESVCVERSP